MKTAMQELRDILENCKMFDITDEQKSIFSSIIYQIDIFLLEKEKEQMISFGKKMQLIQHVSYDDDVTYCFEPEKYYKETYNQNK
jgi:hypothetical protein